ncbi:hypothetical protein LZK75_38500 (plasmid) [Rhizobium leguminosarum]|nr:hypothetical protein LZK75_38500 [Rhizobium leguminosarum]
MDDLAPDKAAEAIYALSREADVIGMITSDHPQVNHAVDGLAAENIPVVTMISDISTASRAAYVGNDCVKKGPHGRVVHSRAEWQWRQGFRLRRKSPISCARTKRNGVSIILPGERAGLSDAGDGCNP